jgi:CRISP-associated protein Cas1
MLNTAIEPEISDSQNWAARSEFWHKHAGSLIGKRKRRERQTAPLILCGHGVSLRVEHGALVIRDGFTHYPQEQGRYRFFRGDLELPTRILLLDGSGTLSFDVLTWLAEQGVAPARVKWTGEVATVASGNGFSADRAKVDWQSRTRVDPALRRAFAVELIAQKLRNSIVTLESCFERSDAVALAIAKARASITALSQVAGFEMMEVLTIEGQCAVAYFGTFKTAPMKWTGTSTRPIPDDWRTFKSRSSLTSGKVPKNRRASHPLNAMLNYAYTVRQAQLQIQAIADGYDPTIGIIHNAHQGSAAYVLDLIEPERPKVDAKILQFVASRSFSLSDFVIRADGVCRLSPQLARAIAALIST